MSEPKDPREKHLPDLSNCSLRAKTSATAYSFRSVDCPYFWAIFTVNDSTGELGIQSDHGSWSYRWNLRGMPEGESLTEFLASVRHVDYLVSKLLSGSEKEREIDRKQTAAAWRESLTEYLNGCDDEDRPSHLLEELSEIIENHDLEDGDLVADRIMEDMSSDLLDAIGEPWEHLRYRPTTEWLLLSKQMMPMFRDYLASTIHPREIQGV